MNVTQSLAASLTSLALTLAFAAPSAAQSSHLEIPADKVQWGPAPPVLPTGAQIAVLIHSLPPELMVTGRMNAN